MTPSQKKAHTIPEDPSDYEYDTSEYILIDMGVVRDSETGILMTKEELSKKKRLIG